ncbi:BDN_1c_G0034040.mRNA.1.CDS.1 [Saccharomyces cerevisiae]|nr:BDN_1c_G0034040.mRNA.1.CDS.1 [Saccharomyces cerevisiae]CAI7321123.1 BDN_1c_G0034040.mRNA.1.CDS.1 [Saccharomyces cerevisiae]
MLGTWPLLEEEKQLVYWVRQEASKGAKFSACLEGRSKSCIIKYGATYVNRRQRCAVLLDWTRKSAGKNGRQKTIRSFVGSAREVGFFQRLRSMRSAGLQGPQYVKLQFSRHHRQLRAYELKSKNALARSACAGVTPSEVPDWTAFLSMLRAVCNKHFGRNWSIFWRQISRVVVTITVDLANVEVLAADNTRVPLYMLMVAVHKEVDSDDVPDGRFDILLCSIV